ncbi:GIDE domain-containing protein [Nocardiopsis coralliicola]
MLVVGAALIVLAAVLAVAALRAVRRYSAHRGIEGVRPRALAARVGEDVRVRGTAVPGPQGGSESRLARADCVWHGHEVLRHYWSPEPSGAEAVRERRADSIADYASAEVFSLVGASARAGGHPVLVDPSDAAVDGVDLALQRVVGRPQKGVRAPADDLLPRVKGRISGLFRGETIEFEYREWLIRPGTPVTVEGRVELRSGRPVIAAAPGGRLRITATETAPEPAAARSGRRALLLGGTTLASATAGLALFLSAV